MKEKLLPYLPGIVLLCLSVILCTYVYQDYGMCWDEPLQRLPTFLSWDYAFHGDKTLFQHATDNHGAGFEMLLIAFEKGMHLTDTRDVYLMRHVVTHIFFLLSAFAGYVLFYRLFRNWIIASLGYLMVVFSPRLYAHSYFNSKDLPFLSMVLLIFALCHLAFDKNKTWLYVLLGLATGYATSIRIMGVMYCVFILMFFFLDWLALRNRKEPAKKHLINAGVFLAGFCFALYISWPYLWPNPIGNFLESFNALAHYTLWTGSVYFQGAYVPGTELPSSYIPTWFTITNPVLWLVGGLAGLVFVVRDFFMHTKTYFRNSTERNFMLYVLCFLAPIISVIAMHSVIYDDWRHLYFVYPPFVLLFLYMANKLLQTKFAIAVWAACVVQLGMIGFFMVKNHPFEQVYFNELISHRSEYLRENYDLEYWGCGFKQELDHILAADTAKVINICCNFDDPVKNNIELLKPQDRARIKILKVDSVKYADYFLTNFRGHPEDYPSKNIEYSVSVLNSTILCVYKLKNVPAKAK